MRYRRSRAKGASFFFTVVTHRRQRLFSCDANMALIKEAFDLTAKRHPFKTDAFVILPDHIHCIWTLPEDDNDFSSRWRLVKSHFSRNCGHRPMVEISDSRRGKGEQAFWQRRFWEHEIKDERDMASHVEYIHYNPVKHGLAMSPAAWPYSSFHDYVQEGMCDIGWGEGELRFESKIGSE